MVTTHGCGSTCSPHVEAEAVGLHQHPGATDRGDGCELIPGTWRWDRCLLAGSWHELHICLLRSEPGFPALLEIPLLLIISSAA